MSRTGTRKGTGKPGGADKSACHRCGGTGYTILKKRGWDFIEHRMFTNEVEVPCSICDGENTLTFIQSFRKQYRLCRTRELTRTLGYFHALKHAWHVAATR